MGRVNLLPNTTVQKKSTTHQKDSDPRQTYIIERYGVLEGVLVLVGTAGIVKVPVDAIGIIVGVLRKPLLFHRQVAVVGPVSEWGQVGAKMHPGIVALAADVVRLHGLVEVPYLPGKSQDFF